MAKIKVSAGQLDVFINKGLAAAGTTQVDIMGHSQAGLVNEKDGWSCQGSQDWGVGAPATHGTSVSGIVELGRSLNLYDPATKVLNEFYASCMQMVYDSTFLKDLSKDGNTSPGVKYFYLATKYDEVVTPYTRSFLRHTNANVTNAVIQDYCEKDITEHVLLFVNPLAFNILENFFSPSPKPQEFDCLTFFDK
ncbi:hypothetical protein BGZ70_001421 [Mortierella alpina]|uniref:Triacylglycerol lipase n=1 Tax=Mortierella alpina TaxID=64518 RepID=A0A9P6IVZ4_MORAP|nr:hypothetical protein BGZ70_001421 [Mortierella alpina]